MCTCYFLKEEEFPRIAKTFDEAFADYFLKMKSSSERWLFNRCVKNSVEFDHSVTARAGDRMVGITLIGIDDWQGRLAAFDAGTGIVPDYRGKGLARRMFEFALPRLRERGVEKFLLEVLQVNEPAIKAYRRAGFEITREFDCFELVPADVRPVEAAPSGIEIRTVDKPAVAAFSGQVDWPPSWENSFATIARIPDEVTMYGAFDGPVCIGVIVYYPLLNWIMSLVVGRPYRRAGVGTMLVSRLAEDLRSTVENVKLINVDHTDIGMLAFLERTGFTVYTRQFEMAMDL